MTSAADTAALHYMHGCFQSFLQPLCDSFCGHCFGLGVRSGFSNRLGVLGVDRLSGSFMAFCSLCVVSFWVGTVSVCATPADSFTSIAESQWFVPQHHASDILEYITGWTGHCVAINAC